MRTPCYCAALRAAARKATALYDEALAPAGLTVAQYSLMRRIEPARGITVTELARIAELDRSTVGRNVKALERRGLVRMLATGDRREAAAELSADGIAALERAAPLWAEAQRRMEAALGDGVKALRKLALSL
ncbi:MAG: MarR family transcriptional regulator [Hyphomicrobiales bacterium]|nr:MarR family transcriptional regulator [Hyphomicrobiales bacterium]